MTSAADLVAFCGVKPAEAMSTWIRERWGQSGYMSHVELEMKRELERHEALMTITFHDPVQRDIYCLENIKSDL